MFNEYTQARANKLEKMQILPVAEPFRASVLWIRALLHENAVVKTSVLRHRHSFYEAHYIFSGEIVYECEGKEYRVGKEEGIVFAPDTYHLVKSTTPDLEKISVAFIESENETIFEGIKSQKAHFFKFTERTLIDFNSLFSEIERETLFSPTLIRNSVLSLLCSLIPERFVRKEKTDTLTDIRVLSAIKYIEDNKHLLPTCNDIAEYCHFNAKYLNRIFKKATGKTLLEYIHETKRKDAEKLLSETDKTLREISESLGFENEYYFNTFFKRLNGIAPGEFRRLIKDKK